MKKFFFDVGANVGQTFDDFLLVDKSARWTDYHIVCIEPSPRHLDGLLRSAAKHARRFQGITVIPTAVGSVTSVVPFYPMEGTGLADSLDPRFRTPLRLGYGIQVPVRQLSVIMARFLQDRKDEAVVKIDTEGGEYEILPDLLSELHRIKRLLVEWHPYDDPERISAEKHLREIFATRGVPLEAWTL